MYGPQLRTPSDTCLEWLNVKKFPSISTGGGFEGNVPSAAGRDGETRWPLANRSEPVMALVATCVSLIVVPHHVPRLWWVSLQPMPEGL